jgi:hypothetical protein
VITPVLIKKRTPVSAAVLPVYIPRDKKTEFGVSKPASSVPKMVLLFVVEKGLFKYKTPHPAKAVEVPRSLIDIAFAPVAVVALPALPKE